MLNIVCVQQGNFEGRGSEYVNVLFDMVSRNLAEGFKGRFVCFTDDPRGLDEGITERPLLKGLNGWWNKLYLFAPGLFDEGDHILYFDLDTLITGRLDEIASYTGEFAILRDLLHGEQGVYNKWQSAVMSWRAGFGSHLWQRFDEQGFPDISGGDQAWIERNQDNADILQDLYPGLFSSYKKSGRKHPKTESVVCFHGRPRPHEVIDGWVPEVWKIGGWSRAELDSFCNTETTKVNANIVYSVSLGLPALEPKPDHSGHVCIVGGGPSLPDSLTEIKAMLGFGHKVWALNNTHDWLIDRGIIPDACVFLDARPENAAFAKRARNDVLYYVASQCDKSMFEALSGKSVATYHNATEGAQETLEPITTGDLHLLGGGTTVGMKAIVIARFIGFKNFHLYGFDSSYREPEGHAYPQPINDNDRALDIVCEGRKFKCAPWMVTQANDFIELANMLVEQDCLITVGGDGLIPYVARMMATPTVTAADVRMLEILKRVKPEFPIGAEIGVFAGDLSSRLLACNGLILYMVDSWAGHGESYCGDSGDWHAGLTQEKQDEYYTLTKKRVAFAGDRARIIRKTSANAAQDIKDGSLDFVFIDADHSYEGCRNDINSWWSKVKPGGLLSGHDYENVDFPKFGVTKAVKEFSSLTGLSHELGDNFTWFITKPEVL
jgi:uncharacterized Rossmann fold enzyme